MTTVKKSEKDRVVIFDTTLRDGEQCPGATMTFEEKLEVAEMLDDMGVDVIEAGFPITSEGDFQAVSEIARRSKNAIIAGLSRAHPKDIDRCAEAVKFGKRGRVHTVIATSPLHMRVKLNMTPEQVLELSIANVTRARNQIDDVEWSAEDGTRSEMEFLCRIVEAVIKAGATTVNIPDTVGYTVPEEYTHFMRTLIERVPNSDKAVFSVHCHNDLGMAVANSLAGLAGGARSGPTWLRLGRLHHAALLQLGTQPFAGGLGAAQHRRGRETHPGETPRFTASFGVTDSGEADSLEELLKIAEGGKLRDPSVMEAQVKRMLADPRAASLPDTTGNPRNYARRSAGCLIVRICAWICDRHGSRTGRRAGLCADP